MLVPLDQGAIVAGHWRVLSMGSLDTRWFAVLAWLALGCGCSAPWLGGRLLVPRPISSSAKPGSELGRSTVFRRPHAEPAQAHAAGMSEAGAAATQEAISGERLVQETVRLSAAEAAALADDGWLKLEPGHDEPDRPRWRHAGVEPLARLAIDAGELRSQLEVGGIVAANAAILLSRRGDDTGLFVLERTIRDRGLRPNLRCAAAEALGRLSGPAAGRTLRQLASEQRVWQQHGGYLAELHAELLRSIRAGIEQADGPLVRLAFEQEATSVLVEALRAWAVGGWSEMEARAVALRLHADAAVRAEALRALASRGHPQAAQFCNAGLNDGVLAVRLAAAECLGMCPGTEARRALLDALAREEEQVRAEVVRALGMRGEFEAVRAAAADRSWRVRRAVAAALAEDATAQGAAALRRLVEDRSPDVQLAAVASLGELPPSLGGEVLLEALGHPVYRTRVAARERLMRLWPPACSYLPDGPPEQRRAMLAELRDLWHASQNGLAGGRDILSKTPNASGDRTRHAEVSPAHAQQDASLPSHDAKDGELAAVRQAIAELRQGHSDAALVYLQSLGTRLPLLLAELSRTGEPLPEAVWHDVLPHIAQEYLWLDLLATGAPLPRRQAAAKLAQHAAQADLPSLVLERVAALGSRERDAAVLRSLLLAVGADGRPAALVLARASLGHNSPEIRRMACEHLERFPAKEHVPALIAALGDPQPSVVAAAARALGVQPPPLDLAALEKLLAAPDRRVRLAAAISLVRLGSPAGIAALERLAHDPDPEVRRLAATAMGELGAPEFVPTLIALLDDQTQVRHAALTALPAAAGYALPETQPGDPEHGLDAALRWQRWWQR